jgi:hypothetical protein
MIRTRWAAIGAAVAVSLGAGGIGLITAAPLSSGERTVLVPLNCRLADTRPAPDTVGPKSSPLGAGETHTFSAHGTNGNCTIPADATALSLNVTALNTTAPLTFLTLWNADQAQPTTSSLNPAAGQPPTPNAVTVDLSATGQFKVFNALGTVNVIIDVTGYYQDHNHDDRYKIEFVLPPPPASYSPFYDAFDFTPDTTFGSINQPFTTTRPGRLLVTTSVSVSASCQNGASEYRLYFVLIDGVAIRSSAVVKQSADKLQQQLTGLTSAVIPAGAHQISVGAECRTGTTSGNTVDFFSVSSVVVLPEP